MQVMPSIAVITETEAEAEYFEENDVYPSDFIEYRGFTGKLAERIPS